MAVYKSCEWIEHGVILDHSNIVRHCCLHNPNHNGRPIIWENYLGTTDWKDFFRIKKQHRDLFKNGSCLPECKDCIMLEEKDWDDKDYLDQIIITPWLECNSKCVYCWSIEDQNIINNTKKYNVTKVIDSMIKHKVLIKSAHIDFAGGEPTIYEDFEKLLNLFINKKFEDIIIHTSGIKYSKAIEKGINKGFIKIVVSIDAGTEEVHQKIKRVKSYETVWTNVEKYAKAQKKNRIQVETKYIIVPGINDSEKEIDMWLNKCSQLGLKTAILNIDHNWLNENYNNIPLYLYKLMNYAMEKAQQLNISFKLFPQMQQLKDKVEEKQLIQNQAHS